MDFVRTYLRENKLIDGTIVLEHQRKTKLFPYDMRFGAKQSREMCYSIRPKPLMRSWRFLETEANSQTNESSQARRDYVLNSARPVGEPTSGVLSQVVKPGAIRYEQHETSLKVRRAI